MKRLADVGVYCGGASVVALQAFQNNTPRKAIGLEPIASASG